MAQCKHAHGGKHSADTYTKLAAIGEGVSSFISDAYWLGGLIDLAAQLDDNGYGLSWYGMSFGAALALLATAGSVFAHITVNANHQESGIESCHEGINEDNLLAHEYTEEAQSLMPSLTHEHDCNKKHSQEPSLTLLQKAVLVGDFISHTGDIAGPLTFVANIATKNKLSLGAKMLVQCSAALFGGVSSIAGVRTCKKNMLKRNTDLQQVDIERPSSPHRLSPG